MFFKGINILLDVCVRCVGLHIFLFVVEGVLKYYPVIKAYCNYVSLMLLRELVIP